MQVGSNDQSGHVSPIEKLKEAVRVGFGVFAFCSITILGVSIIAWLVLAALDPAHAALAAAMRVARFDLIPLGVVTGLSAFFAAITWDSPWTTTENFERNVHRRLAAIEQRLQIESRREVS